MADESSLKGKEEAECMKDGCDNGRWLDLKKMTLGDFFDCLEQRKSFQIWRRRPANAMSLGFKEMNLERKKVMRNKSVEKYEKRIQELTSHVSLLLQFKHQDQELLLAVLENWPVDKDRLGEEMNSLRNEAVEIEKEIGKDGDAMFMKMNTLQSKADGIDNIAETSLDRQKQLLESQSAALEGKFATVDFAWSW
ncbi:hypothetical protein L1987_25274 [Smallanthus sonchifolius]|uniref:Uncharacterized protein n=1 Tax=Smallanthus sonchifolius TaxID=185202 RepID=A0ACB9IM45_9ASTR|nr:hypothetical protein L1987_25274 [Smallanthus sonchifolius]